MLTEIAPGVNMEKDIIEKTAFQNLKEIDSRIFREEWMETAD